MVSLEQLKSEVVRLKRERDRKEEKLRNFRKSRQDIKNIGIQRKNLMREIEELKNPKSTAFKKNLRRGLEKGSRKTFNILERIVEGISESEKSTRKSKRRRK